MLVEGLYDAARRRKGILTGVKRFLPQKADFLASAVLNGYNRAHRLQIVSLSLASAGHRIQDIPIWNSFELAPGL
jgi:hypothetical protein